MSDSENLTQANPGLSASLTGEITVASVVALFFLFVVALILYLRAKGYSGTMGTLRSSHHHFVFARYIPNITKKPLDSSILKSIPVIVFSSEDFKEEDRVDQCAVCISDIKVGEKVRVLPNCKHGFHVQCIDTWFMSNSTCPLCRNVVMADSSIIIDIKRQQTAEIEVLKSPMLGKLNSLRRIMSSGNLNCTCNDIEKEEMKKSCSVSEFLC